MDDVVRIRVGKHHVGIIGLKKALAEAAEKFGHGPAENVGTWLFERLCDRNYIPSRSAEIYEKAFEREYLLFKGAVCQGPEQEGVRIKVLGPGCPRCDRLKEEVMAALSETGVSGDLEHVRDPVEIARFGVLGTPALVINDEVKVVGSVPTREKITGWVRRAAGHEG